MAFSWKAGIPYPYTTCHKLHLGSGISAHLGVKKDFTILLPRTVCQHTVEFAEAVLCIVILLPGHEHLPLLLAARGGKKSQRGESERKE